ncbi:MAG TPA: NAD(P)/FAD-dependent oxidoreductase [Kofleriaceae bacterium]|nr:NAD(P)/FAD-dependent oxidoreductase [Kofleriaceae bacterium]
MRWDAIIVGGGPAGLSAALLLGRCRRRVLLFDDGHPRNWAARRTHGFLTRDGATPAAIRRAGRREVAAYGVEIRDETVVKAHRRPGGGFAVRSEHGLHTARSLILATGVEDELPDIAGAERLYGRGVYHCPYCDGWEVRDQRLATLARGAVGVELAAGLTTWSRDVVLFTHGWNRFTRAQRAELRALGVELRTERIERLVGPRALRAVALAGGDRVERDALFFHGPARQRCGIAESLGCQLDRAGRVVTGKLESVTPGFYVIGDASRDVQFLIIAAAEGAKAAFDINRHLRREDCARRRHRVG